MAGFKSKAVTNTFTKGMNMDLDKSLMSPDTYRYSENFRLITENNGNTGTLENIKGTIPFIDLSTI